MAEEDIQNELLKIMALHILREITALVHSAPFLVIMVDASNKEQVVFCIRWVDSSLEAHEEFIGLYKVDSTEASVEDD